MCSNLTCFSDVKVRSLFIMGGFSTAEKYNGNLSPVFIRTITQITKGTIEPDVWDFT